MHLGIYGTAVSNCTQLHRIPVELRLLNLFQPISLKNRLDTVLEDYSIKYAKTGMLYSTENVKVVSEKVVFHDLNIVVDPVMVAGSGGFSFNWGLCRVS